LADVLQLHVKTNQAYLITAGFIGVARIFQRVGAPRGGSRISAWSGAIEGPKAPSEARSAGAPKGWGLGRGAVAPPRYGGIAPENF